MPTTWRSLPFVATLAAVVGCGVVVDVRDEVGVQSAPLAAETSAAFFAMGRSASFQPLASYGAISPSPRVASAVFRRVAEGDWAVDFLGWGQLTFVAPDPITFPASAWCMTEHATAVLPVISGRPGTLRLEPSTQACSRVASSRTVVEADYAPDPSTQWNGSPTGANVTRLFLDAWLPGVAVEVRVDTGSGQAPLGLFSSLPNAPTVLWPASPTWSQRLTLTTDANGDASCFLVARPGALSTTWQVDVERGTERVPLRLWVHGVEPVAGCPPTSCDDGVACTVDVCSPVSGACESTPNDIACDDGNLCTADRCDLTTGCGHSPVADGTRCAAGTCVGGACVLPTTLDAIEPTGWASTEGGFNSNHAELRCGDDGRGGAGGYQLFPGVTFDLASLPVGAIARATLNVFQVRVDGDSPYGPVMQRVAVEHVRFTSMWEVDEVPAVAGTIGQRTLSTTPDAGWRSVDVTEAVAFERAATRTRVQFRLGFVPAAADGDTSIDWAVFASNNAPAPNEGQRPTLEVSVGP